MKRVASPFPAPSVTQPSPDGIAPRPVTTFTYDNLSRQVKVTNALSGQTVIAYNSNNWVTSITAPDPGGGAPVTQYGYDVLGRRTSVTDGMGRVTTTAFDADSRVTSVTDNLNHAVSYAYGADSELLTTTDALSHTSTNSYNNRLWLVSTTDANSGTTSYGYDPHGNRTSLTDSLNNATTWTYSAINQVLTDTNQLGFARAYVYNPSGDVTQATDRSGLVRQFTYDNLHRRTAEKWMNGSTVVRTIGYAYDADSEVTSASDPDSSYAYAYDNLGRVTSLDNLGTPNIPRVVLASAYDSMNDRTQLTATVASVKDLLNAYSFDALQRLTQETQMGQTGGNGVAPKGVMYSYNLDGQFTTVMRFDPTTASPHPDIALGSYSYDAANRLTSLNYTHLASAIDGYTLAYDTANRATSMTSSVDGTATYSYDTVNEVTGASYTGTNQPANESNSFDKNGNRTNTGYTTGTNNQITSDGTFNYTYDHEGSRLTRTRISSAQASDYKTVQAWDYRNRLTDVNYYNNQNVLTKHVHYVYDVYDHEIGKQLDATGSGSYGSSEWYTLDLAADPNAPAQPVLQFDANGNLKYRYLDGPSAAGVDAVMAEEAITTQGSAGTTTYPLTDNLGSVRNVESAASLLVDHIIYNSFGQVASESSTSVHHWAGYAGYHPDADTGLDDADHRWYDPTVGRWISEDPLGFGGGDPNVSRYVGNGATNAVDPSGRLKIFGQHFVTPWDPNAGGFSDTAKAWWSAGKVAVSGAAGGGIGGAGTGLVAGGVVGGIGGGIAGGPAGILPGAGLGARVGCVAGAKSGAVAGVINAADCDTPRDAFKGGLKVGSVVGAVVGGAGAAVAPPADPAAGAAPAAPAAPTLEPVTIQLPDGWDAPPPPLPPGGRGLGPLDPPPFPPGGRGPLGPLDPPDPWWPPRGPWFGGPHGAN